jgi:hypothetical protein
MSEEKSCPTHPAVCAIKPVNVANKVDGSLGKSAPEIRAKALTKVKITLGDGTGK